MNLVQCDVCRRYFGEDNLTIKPSELSKSNITHVYCDECLGSNAEPLHLVNELLDKDISRLTEFINLNGFVFKDDYVHISEYISIYRTRKASQTNIY